MIMLVEAINLCEKLKDFIKIFIVLILANIAPGFGMLLGPLKFFKFIKQ